ncbi:M14 family metallopeptidase [Isosphaeraceae bacterium EP7]
MKLDTRFAPALRGSALALILATMGPQAARAQQESRPETKPAQTDPATQPPPQLPSLFPAGYLDDEGLTAALRREATAHPQVVTLSSLARTGQGRDVWMVRIGRPEDAGADAGAPKPDPRARRVGPRPAILIVANLEADHLVGSQVALGMIRSLAAADGQDQAVTRMLDRTTIYVVPRLNPDGAERNLELPRGDFRANLRAMDRDRDGRSNEDGPDDLNADGLLLRLRLKDAKATLVADEKDPRIVRKADPAKGEEPIYSEQSEGIDNDDDGQSNEDPSGGVNLNRNWPHNWTEFDPEAGFSPASEPETLGLIRFAFDHPEIAAVWSFSLNDNLKAEPKKPGSDLDDADLPYVAELSRLYNKALGAKASEVTVNAPAPPRNGDAAKAEATKADATKPATAAAPRPRTALNLAAATGTPAPGATSDGALSEWAYHQFGALGLSTRLWSVPDIPEPAAGQAKPPSDGEARWLYWNDNVAGGRAFVPFVKLDHPTLGAVEVGGWRPGVRLNPPADLIPALVEAHSTFLADLAARLPRLEWVDVKAEPKGGGLVEVVATVRNAGDLPTATAQAAKIRRTEPVLVRLDPAGATILAGRPLERIDVLAASGGRKELRWLLLLPANAPQGAEPPTITLDAAAPRAGRARASVPLR